MSRESRRTRESRSAHQSSSHAERVPLVIDNGSYQCRIGWATSAAPSLVFRNLIAKPRKERGKKDADPPVTPPIQIGNDIVNLEAVRFQLRTQFDRNVVTHFEAQEQVFDYIFSNLGIDTDGRVQHPIVLTEAFVNPNYCRQLMSELLFECYGVPSLTSGVDALFSFYHNNVGNTGLVLNCGYHTAHVIPVVRGETVFSKAKRINIGGFQIITYLHRLLQLKYPMHLNAITLSRVEEIVHEHCRVAYHYQDEIKNWTDVRRYDANVIKIQLPYVQPVAAPSTSIEAQKERKKEMARRLIEMNARKREEKLAEDEEQLNQLLALQDMCEESNNEEFEQAIQSFGIKNEEDLMQRINKLNSRIDKVKQKIANSAENELNPNTEERNSSTTSNKIQPPSDPALLNSWLAEYRKKRSDIMEARLVRKQRRLDMAKRRTAAAQERMRIISQLARKEKANDDFGMRDEDWDVYKTISKEGNDSDSDVENEKIMEIDEVLREYDPQFTENIDGEVSKIGHMEAYQLHIGLESLRAPELIFQPFMMGNFEAGLAETIEYVLKQFDSETQLDLANNVFVTGGCANFPGLKERLSRELLEMRPFQSPHCVNMAKNPSLDPWHGACSFAKNKKMEKYLITQQEYNEMGGEYIKEHYASNKYYVTPVAFVCPSSGSVIEKADI